MYTNNNKKSTIFLIDYIKLIPLDTWKLIIQMDKELSDEHLKNGACRQCKSKNLRYHKYQRKPRFGLFEENVPIEIQNEFCYRHSSKCSDCGAQNTPASVKFLGRKIHVGLFVILTNLYLERLPNIKNIQYLLSNDVRARTALRWVYWFCNTLIKSPIWKIVQGTIGIVRTVTQLVTQFTSQFTPEEYVFPWIIRAIRLITIPQNYSGEGDIPLRILKQFFLLLKINT